MAALSCLDSVAILPALGAAILLPSAVATALRLEEDAREPITVPPSVDAFLQRVIIDDLAVDFDLDAQTGRMRNPSLDIPTTRSPLEDLDVSEGVRPGLDTWSVVWYCGMFAAFTSLFLIMPCSQVLCRAGLLHGHGDPRLRPRAPLAALHAHGYATPPPPYKQFAPPAYEDVVLDLGLRPGVCLPGKAVPDGGDASKDKECDALAVYVIPLRHAAGEAPA